MLTNLTNLAFDFTDMKNTTLKVSYKGQLLDEKNDIKKFDDLTDLETSLRDNLKRMCFDFMTPIQKAVIPYLKGGSDVMGCSETGSGKTIAFLLPIVTKMLKEGPPEAKQSQSATPVTLVLVPTRELAEQVYKEAKKLCHKTGINTVKIYGGVGHDRQLR
jgi:ATP-dependent RNA helicase DDX3X